MSEISLELIRERHLKESIKSSYKSSDPMQDFEDIDDLLALVGCLSSWNPGLPPAPGTYAVRTIGAKMLPTCTKITNPWGNWSTLEWVKLPE